MDTYQDILNQIALLKKDLNLAADSPSYTILCLLERLAQVSQKVEQDTKGAVDSLRTSLLDA